jgi:catechol 2,3-dioxygenase-like lactoylglutathione lyase family enzyme
VPSEGEVDARSVAKRLNATGLDHLVLWVADVETSARFYERALGMRRVSFGEGRVAVAFAQHKLNLNLVGAGEPAADPLDFCVIVDCATAELLDTLRANGIEVALGPVLRHGALGEMSSVYVLDPDSNVVEIATYAGADMPR